MGELKQRGSIWWIRYYRNGRRFEESSGSTKEGDAKRLLKLREGAIAQGVPITPSVGRIRIDELLYDLLTEYRVNKRKSIKNLVGIATNHLRPWFTGRRAANLTTADVNAYIDHRQEEGAENSTINRELAMLKRAFVLAVRAGKLLTRPHIPMLVEDNVRQGFFESDQFAAVRRHLPDEIKPVATFDYWTGWRTHSEILTLQWAQVDRKAGIIRLEPGTTKNKLGRSIVYGRIAELREMIETQWAKHEALKKDDHICPWVFFRMKGRRRGPKVPKPIKYFRRSWLTACRLAGCPGRTPHDFRRTAVRNLELAGVPRAVAMLTTGHKTESVYRRYAIVSPQDLEDAAVRLNETLAGTNSGTIASRAPISGNRPKAANS